MADVIALEARWWWATLIGVVVPLLLTVSGALVTPGWVCLLCEPSAVGTFTGGIVQLLGPMLAVSAGIAATAQSYRLLARA